MKHVFVPGKVLEKTLVDPGEQPSNLAHRSFLRERIRAALHDGNHRRWVSVLILALGLDEGYQYSWDEIGRILGISKEYARSLFAFGVRLLSYPIYGLHSFLDVD
jgi:hypothetical protein